MVAAWGGYVFVLNMIGLHALTLVLLGRFSPQLHHAYSMWFIIGTSGAIFGPARYLVGWQPFQSMEQLGPLCVFGIIQLLQVCQVLQARAERSSGPMSANERFLLRVKVLLPMARGIEFR